MKNSMPLNQDVFWKREFFSKFKQPTVYLRRKNDLTIRPIAKIADQGELWLARLFQGSELNSKCKNKINVYKNGVVIHEILLQRLAQRTIIGRHPEADLQLESYKLAMYHAVIIKENESFYIENLCPEIGTLVNRKKLKFKYKMLLTNGMFVDLPGFRLEFIIEDYLILKKEMSTKVDDQELISEFFYHPPTPKPSPLLVNLVEQQSKLNVWSCGTTELRVVDIIQETYECNTYRMVGLQPTLFSYKPGQFITFILNIYGRKVKRSYSMSSSPSRPYLLEVTIKRVPGGLVSNWFFEHVRLGDRLQVNGPIGKFTCFNFPSSKMLFIGAGSGVTPILSMSRWITDTVSDVNVKLLASFKSPSEIIFRKELELISARNNGFQVAVTVTAGWSGTDFWNGYTGRISEQMLKTFTPDILERDIFICGPEFFSRNVKNILIDLNYDMSRYHSESFSSGRSVQGALGNRIVTLKGHRHRVTFSQSKLVVDSDEFISLLDLAEAHGIEIDYSCRTGNCGECEVKCTGIVAVNKNCEIDKKSKAAGYIYACCCTALSDLVLDI